MQGHKEFQLWKFKQCCVGLQTWTKFRTHTQISTLNKHIQLSDCLFVSQTVKEIRCREQKKSSSNSKSVSMVNVNWQKIVQSTWEWVLTVCAFSGFCISGRGLNYAGNVSITKSGRLCQHWKHSFPHPIMRCKNANLQVKSPLARNQKTVPLYKKC